MNNNQNNQSNNWRNAAGVSNPETNKVDFITQPSLIVNQMEYIVTVDESFFIIKCGCCNMRMNLDRSHVHAIIPFMRMYLESNTNQEFWEKVQKFWDEISQENDSNDVSLCVK